MPELRRNNEKTVIVLLTKNAKQKIKKELRRCQGKETGGILLGVHFGAVLLVIDTTSSGENSRHEKCRFEMDMSFALNEVNSIIKKHVLFNCGIAGIWHNHNNEYCVFSSDDMQTNQAYASLNKFGAISVLMTQRNGEDILNCFHVKKKPVGGLKLKLKFTKKI